jgi:hypothetical protein
MVNGEDFGVRLADVKVPVLGEVVKIGDEAVETFGRVADNGHVIDIEETDKFRQFVAAKMFMWSLPLTVLESDTFVGVLEAWRTM